MKTSTLLISLFLINSSFFAGHIFMHFIGSINPFLLVGGEIFLGIAYAVNSILKDVRRVFDVDVKL